MRNIIIALVCFVISNANALSFHYGNRSVPLTTVKHTTPSLNVRNADGSVHYGALFNVNDYTVPPNVVHVRDYDGVEYFLSPWCDAGYYPSSETNECIPCGYGHFCAGGNHRETCTYGIIACDTKNNTFDPPMPAGTDGMYNRALTMAEVNQYVPVTDISEYLSVFSGYAGYEESIYCGTLPDDSVLASADRTIEPGTYIVAHEYTTNLTDNQNSIITGRQGCASSAYIVIFTHNVQYRPVNICNYIHNVFDTQHDTYQKYDLKLPSSFYLTNENITNINNIAQIMSSDIGGLYLYRLK